MCSPRWLTFCLRATDTRHDAISEASPSATGKWRRLTFIISIKFHVVIFPRRFAEVCGSLFGEDLIPNEDFLYDKARLKVAEQKIQTLVHGKSTVRMVDQQCVQTVHCLVRWLQGSRAY